MSGIQLIKKFTTFAVDRTFSHNMSPRSKAQIEEIREASISKILNAALELFAIKGFDSSSIADIAKKANISKGLMYNYFSSKDDLLKALIDQLNKGEKNMMANIFDEDPKKMLENVIRVFFKELRENYQQWVFISKLVLQVDRFEFVSTLAKEMYSNYLILFEQLLTGIGMKQPSSEAKLLGAMFDGIGYQFLIIKDEYPLDEIENYLIQKYCEDEVY
ncbi:MAG: TetR/AcrR family transcriptional regulator [Cytophagales bacterium]|nr:TetR/AcrR family transcriptional regulator [Cytophagales bacterium]